MTDRKRLFVLIGVMTAVSLIVTVITVYILYTAAFAEQRARLLETCHSQARLLEAVAAYARDHTPDRWKTATLTQITDAHRRYEGFGRTGEFTLAHRQDDHIVFLLRHRHYDLSNPQPVPFRGVDSDRALPMQLALLDSSGVVIGPDYRGTRVLAAHEPVNGLNWGIVAKIDLAELRAPFFRAGGIAVLITLLLASVGAWVSLRLSTPVIEHIEESAARTEAVLETATEGIITTNAQGIIESFNRAAEDIFGYDRDEVMGAHVSRLVPEAYDDLSTTIDAHLSPGERHVVWSEREITGRRKDGTHFPLQVAVSAVVVNDQCILTGIVRDITERKRAEEELKRAREQLEERVQERTEELESFTYSISHDLRSPVRAVDGFAQLLRQDHADQLDAEGKRLLSVIHDSAQRMGRLIDDLLAFSRLGQCEMHRRRVDVERIARETLEQTLTGDGARRVTVSVDALPDAVGDASMLRRVFDHLFSNAIKFTRPVDAPTIEVGAVEHNGDVAYYVRDNGAGFDATYADKMFGVFQRLHDEDVDGTGVGLAIVERIVRRHDGRVWADGAVGEGATIYFTLPPARSPSTAT
jgi:PAS domain S-box-containing protein